MPDPSAFSITPEQTTVAVIGLGYVGLPLALSFSHKGFKVLGVDSDQDRVDRLLACESYITDISDKELARAIRKERFVPTTDMACLANAQVIIICVPTPIKRRYTPDISFILSAVRSVSKYMSRGSLVVLESTTYPGTTEETMLPELQKGGRKVGKDFFLAFSPERIDPGNPDFEVTDIPKVVGGVTPKCNRLAEDLYRSIIKDVHMVSSPRAAEMSKLLENTFRLVNIGWVNEAAMLAHALDIDIWEVVDAAKTKPFGFMPFYPGLGVGGHCIPEDPIYLYWKAKRKGRASKFIKLSADVNSAMPSYVTERLNAILGERQKTLSQANVLVLGVTYKKDVKDLRRSPAIKFIDQLLRSKVKVSYYDPFVPYLDLDGLKLDGVALSPKVIKTFDVVVFAVDHTDIDCEKVLRNAKVVFDLKNVYKGCRSKKIVRL